MFNLLPPALAVPVVTMIKDTLPLLGIALIRIGLYMSIFFQKFQTEMCQKLQHAKLLKLENVARVIKFDHIKKLRA